MRRDLRQNVGLDALRAAAATAVVAGHLRLMLFRNYSQTRHSPAAAAFYLLGTLHHPAVIVFFVLSGFWVGGSVIRAFRRDQFRWSDYATKRLSRLWVVVIPALVLTGVLDHLGLRYLAHTSAYQVPPVYHEMPADVRANLSSSALVGNAFFLQDLAHPGVSTFGTNTPLWSLAAEFWFYVSFPLMLVAVVGWKRRWRSAAACLALFFAIGLLVGLTIIEYFTVWLLGAAVAYCTGPVRRFLRRRTYSALHLAQALAAFLVFAAMAIDTQPGNYPRDFLLGSCTSVLVALLVVDVGNARPLALIGRYGASSSYSLYAIHFPMVVLLSALLVPHLADRWTFGPATVTGYVAILIGILIVGWGFSTVTERHTDDVRGWLSRRWPALRYRAMPEAVTVSVPRSREAAPMRRPARGATRRQAAHRQR